MNYMFLYLCTLLTSTYVSWLKKNLIPKRNWMKWSYGSITMLMNFQKKCRLTKRLLPRIWNLLLKVASCRLNNVWVTIRWLELLDCSNKSERTLKTINDILLLFDKRIKRLYFIDNRLIFELGFHQHYVCSHCLLYTSDAADEL